MHTAVVLGGGFALLCFCLATGYVLREFAPGATAAAALVFIPLWLAAAVANLWLGVARAGYPVRDEAPVFALVFGLPCVVALLAWWLFAAPTARAAEAAPPLPQGAVSRLPPLPQPLDPILREMFDKRRAMGGSVINLSLVRGHAPKLAKSGEIAAFSLRFDAVTPRDLRELVIMRTAQIVGADYEINQHRPLMKMCGFSDRQIGELAAWQGSQLFDERQRAVLGFVEQMSHGGEVDDATYAELARRFSPQEIVEIAMTVSSYYGTGLFTKALRIQPETDGRLTVAGKC